MGVRTVGPMVSFSGAHEDVCLPCQDLEIPPPPTNLLYPLRKGQTLSCAFPFGVGQDMPLRRETLERIAGDRW